MWAKSSLAEDQSALLGGTADENPSDSRKLGVLPWYLVSWAGIRLLCESWSTICHYIYFEDHRILWVVNGQLQWLATGHGKVRSGLYS